MSASALPKAPPIPIYVIFRKWKIANSSDPMLDRILTDLFSPELAGWMEAPKHESSIRLWDIRAPYAILPYIDLPHSIKERRGVAIITADGQRGWAKWDMVVDDEHSMAVEDTDSDILPFVTALEDNNWELTVMKAEEVDLKRIFHKRGDDGMFDATSSFLWQGDSCTWCGHPMAYKGSDECEACGVERGGKPDYTDPSITVIKADETTPADFSKSLSKDWQ